MRNNRTRKLALCAMLSAIALIFSYVEMLIPISVGIPGVKLGFANIAVLYAIYALGDRYGLTVNVVRIALAGLLFGSVFSVLYAFAGGMVSLGAMLLLKKAKVFSVTGVSMMGGVFHNLGQLIVAALVVKTPQVMIYFPVLIFSGIAAGIVNGIIARLCIDRIKLKF
ncbi:MAG: Gx transporter family protein [Eubacteriales bacterium]|nr:Gx transporter family protein [Eubacteriales bacterium]